MSNGEPIVIRNVTDKAYADFAVNLKAHVFKYAGVDSREVGDWVEVTLKGLIDYRVFYLVYDQAYALAYGVETSSKKSQRVLPTRIDACHQCGYIDIQKPFIADAKRTLFVVCNHPAVRAVAENIPTLLVELKLSLTDPVWVEVQEKTATIPKWCPLERA